MHIQVIVNAYSSKARIVKQQPDRRGCHLLVLCLGQIHRKKTKKTRDKKKTPDLVRKDGLFYFTSFFDFL